MSSTRQFFTVLSAALCFCLLFAANALAATVVTDTTDYAPGETVVITGSGFFAWEMVTVQVVHADGDPLDGLGHDPWDVQADGSGNFVAYWPVPYDDNEGETLLVTATGQTSSLVATTTFTDAIKVNLDQLQNGTTSSAPNWANGNINTSNSCYSENRGVPFRYFITGLAGGVSHYFTIQMEWTKGGVHAYDYLVDYDFSEAAEIAAAGGVCGTISTAVPDDCNPVLSAFPFPDPSNAANYTGPIPGDFFPAGFILDGPANLQFYNATIDSIGPYFFSGTASDRELNLLVFFTTIADGSAGFYWAGHLAHGVPGKWGIGNGSASVSGAPYHMRVQNFDGSGAKNQDRSIQNGVLCLPPQATFTCADSVLSCATVSSSCAATDLTADTYLWTLTGATIDSGQGTSTIYYTVTAGDWVYITLEACNTTGGCPGDFCCNEHTDSVRVDVDNTPPELICPPDLTLECDVDPAPALTGSPGVSDDCDPNPTLGYSDSVAPGACPQEQTITRTWTATDAAGNSASCSQTITIVDTTPPVLSGCPGDVAYECISDVPAPASVTATDNCDPNPVVSFTESQSNPGSSCNNTITRTWTATDACGNSATCSQTITVDDNTAPVIACPADADVSCDASTDPVNTGSATATDNCDASPDVAYSDNVIPSGICDQTYTIERTWTATDDCGNSASCLQIIQVSDQTPPVLSGCPADASYDCYALVPPPPPLVAVPPGVSATDNCDPNPTVTFSETQSNPGSSCNNTIIRTWTATDACGNSSSCTQVITVNDNVPPTIAGCPGDASYDCITAVPPPATVTATDNCEGVALDFVEVQSNPGLSCNNIITRTWTATDACGNQAVCQQTITVDDRVLPALDCPADVTVECDQPTDPGATGVATATDNCDPNPAVAFSDNVVPGAICPQAYTIERTWTAIDACGNQATCLQIITVVDTQAPTLVGVPADATVECSTIPDPPIVTATDNCDTDVPVDFSETIINGSCPYTIERTWTATDDCGNSVSLTQVLLVDDSQAPSITCPVNVTVECDEPTDPASTGTATATDNCDTDPAISFSDSEAPGQCPQEKTITRTWTATDECGNQSSCDQIITVLDRTPPVLVGCPDDVTVECDAVPDPATVTATDNCDPAPAVTVASSIAPGNCPDSYTIERSWTATDACGNSATCTQVITVLDRTPPAIVCPADVSVECDQPTDPDATGVATATDNCDDNPSVDFADNVIPGNCPQNYTIERTWTATDRCGNSASCVQVIDVADTTPPAIVCPADASVNCNESTDPESTGLATATDNCDSAPTVTYSDEVINGGCAYTIERTWTATDACGNSASCLQVIEVTDDTPPQIACPEDVTVECDASTDPAATGSATATDDCDQAPVVTYSDNIVPNGCPQEFLIERTWTATDVCGNSATCLQLIQVRDTTPPTITCPDDRTFECGNLGDFGTPTADDNCDTEVDISLVQRDSVETVDPKGYQLTLTYEATDDCGNSATCQQVIQVLISTPPTITIVAPADTLLCEAGELCLKIDIVDPDNGLSGTSTLGTVNLEDSTVCFTVDASGTYCGTVIIADSCLQADTAEFCIDVIVNTPPEVSCPNDTTLFLCEIEGDVLCLAPFVCTDAEGNVVREEVFGGTLEGDSVCLTITEPGVYVVTYECEDACGEIASCQTIVTVNQPRLVIDTVSSLQNTTVEVCIRVDGVSFPWGGFDFLINYDPVVLTFLEATPGGFLVDCEWEYFTYRIESTNPGLIRIVGIADMNNSNIHPQCLTPEDGDVIACMRFRVTNDRRYGCQSSPLLFYWVDCGDNTISDPTGNVLYIAGDGAFVLGHEGNDLTGTPFFGGPPLPCPADKYVPLPCVEYKGGKVRIICPGEIDDRGDMNLNAVPYEIADAVLYTLYMTDGPSVFTINAEGQIAASDVNADGIPLTVADLVYLIRVITGDADPIQEDLIGNGPKIAGIVGTFDAASAQQGRTVSVSTVSDYDMGAGLFVFRYEGAQISDVSAVGRASGMDVRYQAADGELRVLVYDIGDRQSIAAGSGDILNVVTDGVGTVELVSVESATFDGGALAANVTAKVVPQTFALHANFPNPFNPSTSMAIDFPTESEYTLTIYNITGQVVKTFQGSAQAGTHTITWTGDNDAGQRVASGVYLYRLEAGEFSAIRKMVFMK